jgi:hypothetical protein
MKNALSALVTLLVLCALAGGARAQRADKGSDATPIRSIYTGLTARACRTIQVDGESGSSVQSCPGVSGYRLLVEDSDNRMSVTVVTPDGKKCPLDYWHSVTLNFSTLGSKAEWRVIKKGGRTVPFALIVRVNATDPETDRVTSYLSVSKITPQKICVIDKVAPGPRANLEARQAADESGVRPCMKE